MNINIECCIMLNDLPIGTRFRFVGDSEGECFTLLSKTLDPYGHYRCKIRYEYGYKFVNGNLFQSANARVILIP